MFGNANIEPKSDGSWAPLVMMVVAMFTDAFLYEMVVPLTPMTNAGAIDDAHIEMLYGGYAFSVLLLTPLWSWLTERIGYKRSMILGAIAQLIAVLLFALAQNFTMLLAARIVEGASSAATWTVGLALIAENYPTRRVQKMGLVMSGSTIGSVFGPLVGGVMYDWGGYFAPFYVAFVLLLADLALRLTLLQHLARPMIGQNVLSVLLRNRAVLVAALGVALVAWNWAGVIEPWLPSHLENNYEAAPSAVGFIFTASCLAYALVTSPIDRLAERRGLGKTISVGLVLMAVGMPLLTLHLSLLGIGLILSLISIGFAFALNPTLAALADAVDHCALGAYAAVYAIFNIAYSVGTIGGAAATGVLTHYLSLMESFLVSSLVLITAVPLIIWGLRTKSAPASVPA